jgi:phage terminase small subunit
MVYTGTEMGRKTSLRQEMFAKEYVIDLNGTRAAIASGYSEKGASVRAAQLLSISRVRKLIDQNQSRRASKLDIKAEKIAEELARLAFANSWDYMRVDEQGRPQIDLSNLTRDQAAAIQEIREDATGGQGDGERRLVVRTTFKLADKRGALELLGRHLGMFQDKLAVSGLEGLAEQLALMRQKKTGGANG